MWHCSVFSISFCFLFFFFFLTPFQNSSSTTALSVDLINTTCKQCADKSRTTILSYGFCLTSLQAIPFSHAMNLEGLAIIAMELTVENATSTVSSIGKMLSSGAFDPFAMGCLKGCLELYDDAVAMMLLLLSVDSVP
ncbi:hypothetical protein F0562_007960 [Nyssa sinensis]|uniref:Pectinesterase inhibitor domain-containing protein n=1 Tax=Nyssa sinensis TaxID=561372 RepID=A0A5J5A622_9ASTE|nr:hypothetical protein F0562_007960 [Nyssa sinensis]